MNAVFGSWLFGMSLGAGALGGMVRSHPPYPVAALGTGAAVAVCFSPEEDCTGFAVDAIDRASPLAIGHYPAKGQQF